MKRLSLILALFLASCGDDTPDPTDPPDVAGPVDEASQWHCYLSSNHHACSCTGPGEVTPEVNAWTDAECERLVLLAGEM